MAGRSYPTALSNISLSILISYKCVEVIFPRMESVAVISLVYKVQMSKPMQLLRQCFSTLYLHDGDLWHSIIHGCLNKPKCSLSLRVLSQRRVCAPHIPAGMLAGGARHGAAVAALPRRDTMASRHRLPCSASGEGGSDSLCISSMSQPLLCSWRGLSWGQKVSTFHQLVPDWFFYHIFLCFSYS